MKSNIITEQGRKLILTILISMLLAVPAATATARQDTAQIITSPPHTATTINITIGDFFFSPANVTITAGTTVTWTNTGAIHHTATSDTGVFNSGTLNPGDKYSFTFITGGTYPYHCAFHPMMVATIIVTTPGNNPPGTPTISGPSSGKKGVQYTFTATTTDPDGDTISYYFDWGDGTNSGWTVFVTSGTAVNATHTWQNKGSFTVKVKAKDEHGAESAFASLPVSMPLPRAPLFNGIFIKILEWLLSHPLSQYQ